MNTQLSTNQKKLAGKVAIGVALVIAAITLLALSFQTAKSDDASVASTASVVTDQSDYAPGSTAYIIGSGFAPGDRVKVLVHHADGTPDTGEDHEEWEVWADAYGNFLTTWHVCEDDCAGSTLRLTAVGDSGASAQTTFTDGPGGPPPCSSGNGVVTVAGNGGSCVAGTPPSGNGPYNWEVAQGGSYTMTITGVTECSGDTITVFVQSSDSGNFCFNATGGSGTYVGTFTMPNPACNTMPISYKCGADAACDNAGNSAIAARGPGACTVHLRASTFDDNCVRTGDDTDCCPADITVDCNETTPGGGTVVNFSLPAGAVSDPTSGSTFAVGTTPVTVTFANKNTCTFNVTVRNNCAEPGCDCALTIDCPKDTSVECGGDTSPTATGTATVTPTGADCGTVTPTYVDSLDANTCVITRTWSAINPCDLTTVSCEQHIAVLGKICGKKFYDTNANGLDDDGQVVEGLKIVLSGTSSATNYTAKDGTYCFTGLAPGTYTVTEVLPSATWVATTATSCEVTLTCGDCSKVCNFGNVCLGAGGGLTLGYWSNKNGEKTMCDGGSPGPELALLSGLCLRNANGTDFNPATYTPFRSWLLSATAVNMSYMLSAQLAAMELNVEAGLVSGASLVYAPGCGTFISIGNLKTAANAALCADGSTLAGDPNRAPQECWKNALDQANNNLNFVQPTPCPITTPY